jgi:hypothetical protein
VGRSTAGARRGSRGWRRTPRETQVLIRPAPPAPPARHRKPGSSLPEMGSAARRRDRATEPPRSTDPRVRAQDRPFGPRGSAAIGEAPAGTPPRSAPHPRRRCGRGQGLQALTAPRSDSVSSPPAAVPPHLRLTGPAPVVEVTAPASRTGIPGDA